MRVTTGITWPQEIEQDLYLGSAVATCPACFLGTDHIATRHLQCSALNAEVLVER